MRLAATILLSRRRGLRQPRQRGLILLISSMLLAEIEAFFVLCSLFFLFQVFLRSGVLIIFIVFGMTTVVETKGQHYMKLQGENVPINMAPCGIKCLACNQTFVPEQLQRHLSTHVNPQFIKVSPVFNATTPEKPRLSSILAEDPEKMQDIWVKSFIPDDLPRMEREKKVAHRPTGQDKLLNRLPFEGLISLQPDLRKDISSHLGETVDESVQPVQQLDIKKNVKIGKVYNEVKNKQLHFYMNEREASRNVDLRTQKEKKIRDEDTQASDAYSVSRAPVPGEERSLFTPRKENRQTYTLSSGLKNPANALRISTLSRYEPRPEVEEVSQISKSRSTVVGPASRYMPLRGQQSHSHNHECPCCKGFYCSYCKSSVPPIYRPVPDKDGNYHFHPKQDERAVEFYRDHYYPRDQHVCTGCEKEMVNGRIMENSPRI